MILNARAYSANIGEVYRRRIEWVWPSAAYEDFGLRLERLVFAFLQVGHPAMGAFAENCPGFGIKKRPTSLVTLSLCDLFTLMKPAFQTQRKSPFLSSPV